MPSINATGETLFPGIPDEAWLELIDERYGNGLEIESLLGGSRSAGARTKTFRASYLDRGGGHRRGACVVKLGHKKEVMRDYEGWLNFGRGQPRRDSFARMDPPNEADFGAVVVIDFLGTVEAPMRSLAAETAAGFPLLAETVERVVGGVLQPLHECLQSDEGHLPYFSLTQGEAVGNWLRSDKSEAIRQRLEKDPVTADIWTLDEVSDPDHFVRLPNHLPAALDGGRLPYADTEIRLPKGIVHGDSNFDNIFVAHTGEPPRLESVGMIDFEWCSEGPPDSPYDDLARIECELLFGQRAPVHRREMTHAIAFGDPLMRDGFPLSAGDEPDRDIFEAIRIVRLRVAELAGARTSEETSAYLRGYLVTLFGLAMQYLRYEIPGEDTRSEVLCLCQLLAARLTTAEGDSMPPPFSPRFKTHDRRQGTVTNTDNIYVLGANGANTYAGLVTSGPGTKENFLAVCAFEILDADRNGWVAFGIGSDAEAPERTGLAATVGPGNDARLRTNIVSHVESRHNRRGPVLGGLDETLASPLVARIVRTPLQLEIAVEGECGPPEPAFVRVEIPPDRYWGPFTLTVHQATVRVSSLRVQTILPTGRRRIPYEESSALLDV